MQINVGEPLTIEHIRRQIINDQKKSSKSDDSLGQESLDQTKQQVKEMLEAAKEKAQHIIDEAMKQAEQLKASALQQAREEGYQKGHQEIKEQADELLSDVTRLHQKAQEKYQTALKEAEKDIIKMVLDIAQTILGDEIENRQQAIVLLVSNTLIQCTEVETVTVRVSPDTYDTVDAYKEEIAKKASFSGEIILKKDVSLPRDGCVVETPVGNIDASIHVQLKEIEKAFMEAFRSAS